MKNKKNFIYLVFLLILILATLLVLFFYRKSSTIPGKLKDFAVKDTSSITKIFLADMKGKSVLLVRSKESWLVNDSYPCNMERVKMLLETISKLDVKSTVPLASDDKVIADLATNGIKVEIYKKKKKFRSYYVGSETPDALGTYMILDKKHSVPFVMYIPGFEGYLTTRYFTNVSDWRSKIVFNYNPLDIKKVIVFYSDSTEKSFKLEVMGTNDFRVTPIDDKFKFNWKPDVRKIKRYLVGFQNLQMMDVINDLPKHETDSLLNSIPVVTIAVTDFSGNTNTFKLFYRHTAQKTRVEQKPGIDADYYYGETSLRKGELALIQDLTFNRIFWKISDFKTEK